MTTVQWIYRSPRKATLFPRGCFYLKREPIALMAHPFSLRKFEPTNSCASRPQGSPDGGRVWACLVFFFPFQQSQPRTHSIRLSLPQRDEERRHLAGSFRLVPSIYLMSTVRRDRRGTQVTDLCGAQTSGLCSSPLPKGSPSKIE